MKNNSHHRQNERRLDALERVRSNLNPRMFDPDEWDDDNRAEKEAQAHLHISVLERKITSRAA